MIAACSLCGEIITGPTVPLVPSSDEDKRRIAEIEYEALAESVMLHAAQHHGGAAPVQSAFRTGAAVTQALLVTELMTTADPVVIALGIAARDNLAQRVTPSAVRPDQSDAPASPDVL